MPVDAGIPLAALMLEACIGYPRVLLNSIGHPVMWLGSLLDLLERNWNDPRHHDVYRRLLGIITVLIAVGMAALVGYAISAAAARVDYGDVFVIVVGTVGLAQRSLYEHVRAVLTALNAGDLHAARSAVARIVGRDTAQLSRDQVAAAAIESLAESCNDAIIAPVFWFCIGGLPGLFAYKAINTADSMIGHREERWRAFGWAAARCDDGVNLIPARMAGVLLALAAGRGFKTMWCDASKHASPNAGWPEAALAGALGVRLGGPAAYDGVAHERPYFGCGVLPEARHLTRALTLYKRACLLLWLALVLAYSLQRMAHSSCLL